MTMLQLYFPWRCQNELKSNGQYSHKFMQVYQMIEPNINKFQPYSDIDPDELQNMFEQQYDESSSENESDVSDYEYTSLNPELLGLADESTQAIQTSVNEFATFSKLTKHILSNDAFYEMCRQLNQKQQDIFNALINHIQNIHNIVIYF